MSAVESVAEAVKKRVRSSSKTRAPAKRTKSTLEELTPPPAGQPSKAPAAASVFGQAPFEGEPPLSHASASQATAVFSHASASQATPVFSQATSVLSRVTSALSQNTPTGPRTRGTESALDSHTSSSAATASSLGRGGRGECLRALLLPPPPRVPDFRQELDDFRNTIRAEQRQTAARQEQAFLAASDRFYYMHSRTSSHSCNSFCYNRCTVNSRRPLVFNQPYHHHHHLLSPWTYHGGNTRSKTTSMIRTRKATRSPYKPHPQTLRPRERSSPSLESSMNTLGIAVTAPEAEPAPDVGTVFSDEIAPDSSLVFPIDPAVSKRAATISLKKSKPIGAELKILQNDHAAVVSNTPIPDNVWDQLLSFDKAKVTGGTSATNQDKRICRLADKADAETEYNLSWIGEAAKHGVEASTLALYIGEWMLRVKRGTITPTPEVKAFMLALLAKLQRRSLDQLLKIL